uniref:Uncharacterized protein n=1 Tax=Rhizophora mucronata TaxID=61149 RepID=A0A2P2NZX6_RHIMU
MTAETSLFCIFRKFRIQFHLFGRFFQ